MTQNQSKVVLRNLISAFAAMILSASFSPYAIGADYNPKSLVVDAEDFSQSLYWTAIGIIEPRLVPSADLEERFKGTFTAVGEGCVLLLVNDIDHIIFRKGEHNLARSEFKRRLVHNFSSTDSFRSLIDDQCSMYLNVDSIAQILADAVTKPRPKTDLTQLRANPEAYRNKRVFFNGRGSYLMGTLFVGRVVGDMNPIRINTEGLSTATIEELLKNCGNALITCPVIIIGSVQIDSGGIVINPKSVYISIH
jgi:hypothetical protein